MEYFVKNGRFRPASRSQWDVIHAAIRADGGRTHATIIELDIGVLVCSFSEREARIGLDILQGALDSDYYFGLVGEVVGDLVRYDLQRP